VLEWDNMNIKQFLKPDWRKIIIFFTIVLLTLRAIWLRRPINDDYIVLIISVPYSIAFVIMAGWIMRGPELTGISLAVANIASFILGSLIWYFIICLMVWIYDKFKNKPR